MKIIQPLQDFTTGRDFEGKYTEYEVPYIVIGADSPQSAMNAVWETAPKEIDNMVINETSVDQILSHDTIKIKASYKINEKVLASMEGEEQEAQMSFDCSSTSSHITMSLKQTTSTDHDFLDPKGSIGWNGKEGSECEIAGVDILSPVMRESYTRVFSPNQLDTDYKRTIGRLTGKVNLDSFKGWKPGEVLFLGASFSGAQKQGKISVTFNFAIQENETNKTIATATADGSKVVISKKGWEYLWSISKTKYEDGKMFLNILGVYVDQVYEEKSFGALKI